MKLETQYDAIIIGAGISGLMCAKKLHDSGLNILVIDKGRNFGGRMSTRHFNNAIFDHGAQFFTSKTKIFNDYCNKWYKSGIIDIWYDYDLLKKSSNKYPRWFCKNGMNTLPKYIASKINVLRSTCITKIKKNNNLWTVYSNELNKFQAKKLIITIPMPQILKLIDESDHIFNRDMIKNFKSIKYEKGLAILAVLDDQSGIPYPGIIQPNNNDIAWIADNHIKGLSSIPALTIHTSADYAFRMFEKDSEEQALTILNNIHQYIKSNYKEYQVHKWGYTTPIKYLKSDDYQFNEQEIFFAGDSFSGPRIESSALSGLNTANKILNRQ